MLELNSYIDSNGYYVSPKNGKTYKTKKSFISHMSFKKSDKRYNFKNEARTPCKYCSVSVQSSNLDRHETSCYLNPVNVKLCQVCSKPIKNFKVNKSTCSRSCSNTFYRRGENNGNWREESYRSTCFLAHKKECVVCGESNIVEVHHYDEDKSNNDPSNLIPLCPTHHQYWHSKYRLLVKNVVDLYISKWKVNRV